MGKTQDDNGTPKAGTAGTDIRKIRENIIENHSICIVPYIGGRGGFGETFCGHIHELGLTFRELADHFGLSMDELADLTADHIRRLGTTQKEEWGETHHGLG